MQRDTQREDGHTKPPQYRSPRGPTRLRGDQSYRRYQGEGWACPAGEGPRRWEGQSHEVPTRAEQRFAGAGRIPAEKTRAGGTPGAAGVHLAPPHRGSEAAWPL